MRARYNAKRTSLGREWELSTREDEKKQIELARVKSIADQETKRLEGLKAKVEGVQILAYNDIIIYIYC